LKKIKKNRNADFDQINLENIPAIFHQEEELKPIQSELIHENFRANFKEEIKFEDKNLNEFLSSSTNFSQNKEEFHNHNFKIENNVFTHNENEFPLKSLNNTINIDEKAKPQLSSNNITNNIEEESKKEPNKLSLIFNKSSNNKIKLSLNTKNIKSEAKKSIKSKYKQ